MFCFTSLIGLGSYRSSRLLQGCERHSHSVAALVIGGNHGEKTIFIYKLSTISPIGIYSIWQSDK